MRVWPLTKVHIALIAGLLLTAALACLAYYGYTKNRQMALEMKSVESQVAALSTALEQSNAVSTANKTQLQELANQSKVVVASEQDSLTDAVAKAAPAVVSVVISKDVPLMQMQYVNPFGDNSAFGNNRYQIPIWKQVGTQTQEVGAGTGFFIRSDGYILTNKHVVEDADASYTVLLSTGDKKTATVVYRDPTDDIAVLKVDGTGYPTISFDSSSVLKLGQTVAAIGNALGQYSNTVSVGIISGLNRTIQAQDSDGQIETLTDIIQTDAAINPGNSGGPLLDLAGNAVGINVAVDQGAQSIAFSIPIDTVKTIINKVVP